MLNIRLQEKNLLLGVAFVGMLIPFNYLYKNNACWTIKLDTNVANILSFVVVKKTSAVPTSQKYILFIFTPINEIL